MHKYMLCKLNINSLQVALPLVVLTAIAYIILLICRLRTSSPKQITDDIRREIKNKGKFKHNNCNLKIENENCFLK